MSTQTFVIAKSSSLRLSHCAGELRPHLQRHKKQMGLTNQPHSFPSSWCGLPGLSSSHLTHLLVSNMQPRVMSRFLCGSQTSHPGHGLHSHIHSVHPLRSLWCGRHVEPCDPQSQSGCSQEQVNTSVLRTEVFACPMAVWIMESWIYSAWKRPLALLNPTTNSALPGQSLNFPSEPLLQVF